MSGKGQIVRIVHNPVAAKVLDPSRETKLAISNALTYKVAGSEFSGGGGWDGYSSFFDMRRQVFPAGFVRMVRKRLEREGFRVIVRAQPAPEPLGPERPKVDDFPEDPDYEYQHETVQRLVALRSMIAQVATGGGKSRIFRLAYKRIGRTTLFITTRKSLMYQMKKSIERDLGERCGVLGDGVWEPNTGGVTVALVQTLAARLEEVDIEKEVGREVQAKHNGFEKWAAQKMLAEGLPADKESMKLAPTELIQKVTARKAELKKEFWDANPVSGIAASAKARAAEQQSKRETTLDFLNKIEFVTAEEAHEVSSDSFYRVMVGCRNAHYRLALTATPFMKDDEEANMRLMASTGSIAIKITEKQLIDKGILATPYFRYVKPARPHMVARSTAWGPAYKRGIVEAEDRNRIIVDQASNAANFGLTTMILVQHKNHGQLVLKALLKKGLRADFIYGEANQKRRQAALDALGSGKLDVLIGTTILDVGVDVPACGAIILAGGGKAEVGTRQRIGRGLRRKKTGPNKAFVLDFEDGWNSHTAKHSAQRRGIVESTPGFAENIQASAEPFDFAAHGFTRTQR